MAEEVENRIATSVGHNKPLEETHPHLTEFVAFLGEFNKETARGVALTAAAFIDDLLEQVLVAYFIENDSRAALVTGFNAPLGTFSSRIAACHALGLISDREHKEAELIRKIRNEFAHKVHASFGDDRIRSFCETLSMSIKPSERQKMDARGRFQTAAVALILNLTNRPYFVGQQRAQHRPWPY